MGDSVINSALRPKMCYADAKYIWCAILGLQLICSVVFWTWVALNYTFQFNTPIWAVINIILLAIFIIQTTFPAVALFGIIRDSYKCMKTGIIWNIMEWQ